MIKPKCCVTIRHFGSFEEKAHDDVVGFKLLCFLGWYTNFIVHAYTGYDGASCLSSVERYDPLTGIWTSCPALACKRRHTKVAVLGVYYFEARYKMWGMKSFISWVIIIGFVELNRAIRKNNIIIHCLLQLVYVYCPLQTSVYMPLPGSIPATSSVAWKDSIPERASGASLQLCYIAGEVLYYAAHRLHRNLNLSWYQMTLLSSGWLPITVRDC